MKLPQSLIKSAIPMLALTCLVSCGQKKEAASVEVGKPYPLDTCLVCDMELKHMANLDVFVYEGQEIKVCDKGEEADFKKDPAKYMKKLADAVAKAKPAE